MTPPLYPTSSLRALCLKCRRYATSHALRESVSSARCRYGGRWGRRWRKGRAVPNECTSLFITSSQTSPTSPCTLSDADYRGILNHSSSWKIHGKTLIVAFRLVVILHTRGLASSPGPPPPPPPPPSPPRRGAWGQG